MELGARESPWPCCQTGLGQEKQGGLPEEVAWKWNEEEVPGD